ncbi:MAG: dihydroorotate oxidase [Alphaproteobacteria bacterium]|nr:dihydroorotate oxidase [Alphaproteobacteria bacterium]
MTTLDRPNRKSTTNSEPRGRVEHSAAGLHVEAMGLGFMNPIGLAAGLDKTGARFAEIAATGAGHVEIGTVDGPFRQPPLDRQRFPLVRLGVNIGSRRKGITPNVLEDYAAAFSTAARSADYVVANLTSPDRERHADSPGLEALFGRLKREQEQAARRTPLLVKVSVDAVAAPPLRALYLARDLGLDGVVLVSSKLQFIEAVARLLDGLTLVSVGGVSNAEDLRCRLAFADLVQIHSAYIQYGPALIPHLLAELEVSQPCRRLSIRS